MRAMVVPETKKIGNHSPGKSRIITVCFILPNTILINQASVAAYSVNPLASIIGLISGSLPLNCRYSSA